MENYLLNKILNLDDKMKMLFMYDLHTHVPQKIISLFKSFKG